MTEVDHQAQEAVANPTRREWLITNYSGFILSCAAKCVGRPVSRSDDEWSIALSAFSEAIDSYDIEKGSFLSHARLVIKRRLIDHQRSQGRRREISTSPDAFWGDERGNALYEVVAVDEQAPDDSLKEELTAANSVFKGYGFSFFDLAGHTPQKRRSRIECADAVDVLVEEPPLLSWMRAKRRLPLNRLCEAASARKKTLSLFRNYIIAGAEILTRDFPSLRRYFSSMHREVRQ